MSPNEPIPFAFRTFRLGDTRTWRARALGTRIELEFVDEDGDLTRRVRECKTRDEARREFEQLVAEQRAEGWIEVVRAPWEAFLEVLVANWTTYAPSFPIATYRDKLLATTCVTPAAIVDAIMELRERYVPHHSGGLAVDFDDTRQRNASEWLREHIEDAVPGLVIALRHSDYRGAMSVESILGETKRTDVSGAVASAILEPGPNRDPALTGHAVYTPTYPLVQLARLPGALTARLVAGLDHEDFRVSNGCATVLATHAKDDAIFDALWSRVAKARTSDGYAVALLRAAEVRRDPAMRGYLDSMRADRRFSDVGFRERIDAALAGLR